MSAVPQKLADILVRGKNNFDLIRLIATVAFIFGHSFYIFPTGGFQEPVMMLLEKNLSGTLAVGAFFFISGILICQSFCRSNTPIRFVVMRVARTYPGVIVCLLSPCS
jgi:peptidoglycan/LPS O-acetylase OafA/YrhL